MWCCGLRSAQDHPPEPNWPEIDTSGLMTVMSPMMKMMVRRRNIEFIDNLKRTLET